MVGFWVYVCEHWFAASHDDGFGCGYESEAGQYYFVTVFYACGYDGRVQRCGARVHGYGVLHARELGEFLLELRDHGTRTERVG
jgi:hypothetical protein